MLTSVNSSPRRVPPLEAAIAVLRRDGPAALTMRAVAAEAGVTATALYRHFENKEALLRAVLAEVYGAFRTHLMAPLEGDDPSVWLHLASSRYLDFALRHRRFYELLFVTPHGLGIDRYPTDFLEGRSPTFRQLRAVVAACMDAGVLRPGEVGDVALTLFAHMHGLVMLHFAGRFADDDARFREFYFRSLEGVVAGLG